MCTHIENLCLQGRNARRQEKSSSPGVSKSVEQSRREAKVTQHQTQGPPKTSGTATTSRTMMTMMTWMTFTQVCQSSCCWFEWLNQDSLSKQNHSLGFCCGCCFCYFFALIYNSLNCIQVVLKVTEVFVKSNLNIYKIFINKNN